MNSWIVTVTCSLLARLLTQMLFNGPTPALGKKLLAAQMTAATRSGSDQNCTDIRAP